MLQSKFEVFNDVKRKIITLSKPFSINSLLYSPADKSQKDSCAFLMIGDEWCNLRDNDPLKEVLDKFVEQQGVFDNEEYSKYLELHAKFKNLKV